MADKPPVLPPASEPFPGSRTPGWNDPPTLQYNPLVAGNTSNPGRTRLNLNKRVAFPLQGTAGSDLTTSKPTAIVPPNQANCGLPPPPSNLSTQPNIAVVHPMSHTISEPTVAVATLPSDAFTQSFRVLRDQLPLVQKSVNVRREEIERRLGIIEQLWQSGSLSAAVQEKIYRLSKSVAEKAYNDAMEIYTTLVANHADECASWAVTLRHIVLTLETPNNSASACPATSNVNSNIAVVPAMFVPAISQPNNATSEPQNSGVQHI